VKADKARCLQWNACYNARDVGGYETRDGWRTRWRTFLRADNLCRLTRHGAEAVVGDGVQTVIDLRSPFELAIDRCPFAPPSAVTSAPTYRNLPVLNQDDPSLSEALNAAASVPAMYAILLERCRPQMAAILCAIGNAAEGGVLVYCHAGKDRTGLVVALVLALAGVPDATIATDYALSDTYLRPLYDYQLRSAPDDVQRQRLEQQIRSPLNVARPETMLETLAHLDALYGGVDAYLCGAGVAKSDLDRVRTRLCG
jgi:protein tyrosine/serine phosphatase